MQSRDLTTRLLTKVRHLPIDTTEPKAGQQPRRAFLYAAACAVAALVLLPVVAQASPRAVCSLTPAYRTGTTATAPAYVHVDCTGTTDSDANVRPFHDLRYTIDYGDSTCASGRGAWANSDVGAPKNSDSSPIGGHVYECAGTFTVASTVCNTAGVCSSDADTVTVEAEDAGWTGANTRCVSTSGNFAGCPAGVSDRMTSNDYDSQLLTGAGKRTLYRCGETFTASGNPTLTDATANGSLIGGFGSCSSTPAVVQMSYSGGLHNVGSANTSLSGWRVRDISYNAPQSSTNDAIWHSTGGSSGAARSKVLLLRVDTLNVALCPSFGNPGTEPAWNSLIAFVDIHCTSVEGDGTGYFMMFQFTTNKGLVVGSLWESNRDGTGWMRLMGIQKLLFAHNRHVATNVANLTLQVRAANGVSGRNDQYNVFSDNRFEDQGTEGFRTLAFCRTHDCTGDDPPAIGQDFIVEGNRFTYGVNPNRPNGAVSVPIQVDKNNVTIRNNIIDWRSFGSSNINVYIAAPGSGISRANGMHVYNNVLIRAGATGSSAGACSDTGGTGDLCRNNLIYDVDSSNTTTVNGTFESSGNNAHLRRTVEGCPFTGRDNACTLSAPGMNVDFNEFRIRSTGGSRDSVVNAGFNFPDTTANGRRPAVFADGFLGCRGAATGGPDGEWDIGAHEFGSIRCGDVTGTPGALAPPTLLAPR